MPVSLVYVSFPSQEVASQLTETLLKEQLCACVNLWQGRSAYWWDGKLESQTEWFGVFKTTRSELMKLKKRYHDLHPYQVPCWIEVTPSSVAEPYFNWITQALAVQK